MSSATPFYTRPSRLIVVHTVTDCCNFFLIIFRWIVLLENAVLFVCFEQSLEVHSVVVNVTFLSQLCVCVCGGGFGVYR